MHKTPIEANHRFRDTSKNSAEERRSAVVFIYKSCAARDSIFFFSFCSFLSFYYCMFNERFDHRGCNIHNDDYRVKGYVHFFMGLLFVHIIIL